MSSWRPDHRARQVWAFVAIARGAPAISQRLLLGLWLYACLDGVGSARELARLCREHVAYRWLCGRVGVNHHTLSDFRSGGKSRAIVGVQIVQKGSDNGLSEAMRPEVERRTGVTVKTHVTDAGYLSKGTVEREAAAGVVRVMPLPINPGGAPATAHQRRPGRARLERPHADRPGPGADAAALRDRRDAPRVVEDLSRDGPDAGAGRPQGDERRSAQRDRLQHDALRPNVRRAAHPAI